MTEQTKSKQTTIKPESSSLDPKIGAVLAWLVPPWTSILFLIVEKDKFVRFYAIQSLALMIVYMVGGMVIGIGTLILTILTFGLFGFVSFFISIFLTIGGIVIWALGLYKAYHGEWFILPVIGPLSLGWAETK